MRWLFSSLREKTRPVRKELGLRGAWGQSRATGSHLGRDSGAEWRDGSELCTHDLQWQLVNNVISLQGLPRSGG